MQTLIVGAEKLAEKNRESWQWLLITQTTTC
jgi:hypothetical protein